MELRLVYTSDAAFHPEYDHTIVVACSDPRWRKAQEDFVGQGLGIKLFIPLFLAGGIEDILTSNDVRTNLSFLMEKLESPKVIILGHRGCAYHRHRFIELRQQYDKGEEWLLESHHRRLIEGANLIQYLNGQASLYYGQLEDSKFTFHELIAS